MKQKRRERMVAIVGRPNVGKSALFNRLAGRRIAIVHDMPGVTRDRLAAPVKDAPFPLEIMDTGGIGATLNDDFGDMVRTEAEIGIAAADAILFVVDALTGIHPVDQVVAELLRKQGKPVILGVNKSDDPRHDNNASDFSRLGFRTVRSFSATHGRGIDQLLETIYETVGAPPEATVDTAEDLAASDSETIRVAILGRPNVGKSSLFNAILGDQRAIVSDVAGTTRDAVDSRHVHKGQHYLMIDTAGIRKQSRVDDSVEAWSVKRANSSIRRADVCMLVYDASRGITAQERKIANLILEENKPCMIVANKFDLWHPDAKSKKARLEELEEYARRELFFLHYAPLVAVSAKEGTHLDSIFGGIARIREASDTGMSTGIFNRMLQEAIEKNRPPAIKSKRLKLLYATLAKEDEVRPIMAPRVVLFVNHGELLTPTYRRYLENSIRGKMPYTGLPIKFDIRQRKKKDELKKG